jgi:MoxR-like ATPase
MFELQTPGRRLAAAEPIPLNGRFPPPVGREEVISRALAVLAAPLPGGRRLNLCLSGSVGQGKTSLALHLAGLLDRPAWLVQGSRALAAADLTDVVVPDGATDRLSILAGPLAAAALCGTLIVDEIAKCREEVLGVLAGVLSDGQVVVRSLTGECIPLTPDFRLIVTVQTGEIECLPSFARDRLVEIRLPDLDQAQLNALLAGRYDEETVRSFIRSFWSAWPREHPVSPRRILNCLDLATRYSGDRPLRDADVAAAVRDCGGLP